MPSILCKYCGQISSNNKVKHHKDCPLYFINPELQNPRKAFWEAGRKDGLKAKFGQAPHFKLAQNPVYVLGYKTGQELQEHRLTHKKVR